MSCLFSHDGNGTTAIHELLPAVCSDFTGWLAAISWFLCFSSILNCFKFPVPLGQILLPKRPTSYWPAHCLAFQLATAWVLVAISIARIGSLTSWSQWFMSERNLASALWFWTPWSLSILFLSWLMFRRRVNLRHLRTVVRDYEKRLPPTAVPRTKGSASQRALKMCCRVFCPMPSCAINLQQKCSDIQCFGNVPFGEDASQVLDIWCKRPSTDENASNPSPAGLAAKKTEKRPVLVVQHGGGWLSGSKRFTDPGVASAYTFVHEGWVGVCISHRKITNSWPLFALDVVEALQWVHDNIASYGGDPTQVVLMGRSSGGHIVAEIATLQALLQHPGGVRDAHPGGVRDAIVDAAAPELVKAVKALRVRPVGMILYYPVLDLKKSSPGLNWCCSCSGCGRYPVKRDQHMMQWFWYLWIASSKEQPVPSPVDKVSAALCPVLIIHGTEDCLVPLETSHQFIQRLKTVRSSAAIATSRSIAAVATSGGARNAEGATPPGTVPDEVIEVRGGCHSFDQVLHDSILLLIDHTLLWSEACLANVNSSPSDPAQTQ